MSAAAGPADDRSGSTLIYPAGAAAPNVDEAPRGAGGTWLFAAVVVLAAGGFIWWRKRSGPAAARRTAGLQIEETRALGNRQFLLVAACDGKRFLLGVAPGSIRLLAPLDGKEPAHDPPAR